MTSGVVVDRTSTLARPAREVWDRITTPEGIRHELRPVLSMTTPHRLRGRTIADVEQLLGEPLGRSWVLLLGVLPVEYDDMRIVAVDPGRSFDEQSTMALMGSWRHERSVEPTSDGGSTVHDRLTFVPRLPLLGRPARVLVGALFAHRHRRLRAWAAGR